LIDHAPLSHRSAAMLANLANTVWIAEAAEAS
jgi:hypothetical protein